MSPELQVIVAYSFIATGVLALLANCLLFFVAIRVDKLQREMRLIVIVAIIDMIYPVITIVTSAVYTLTGKPSTQLEIACKMKGPINYISLFLSMLLVTIIAVERRSRVFHFKMSKLIYGSIICYAVSYVIIVIILGYQELYFLAPSGIDCAPKPENGVISILVVFGLGFSLFIFSFITLGSYLEILYFALNSPHLPTRHVPIESNYELDHVPNKPIQPQSKYYRAPIIMRTLVTSFLYFLLIIPAAILLMMESIVTLPQSGYLSLTISLCLFLAALINPCLVLFAHTIVYQELKLALSPPTSYH